ncbi:MAG: MFS transporter, partial [Gemmatimonadaceae bacterium]
AHLAHAEAAKGARQEGLYTGIWTAGEKLALAIGPAIAGTGLALVGYVSGAPQQGARTIRGMQLLISIGPAILMAASGVFIARRAAPDAVTQSVTP